MIKTAAEQKPTAVLGCPGDAVEATTPQFDQETEMGAGKVGFSVCPGYDVRRALLSLSFCLSSCTAAYLFLFLFFCLFFYSHL